MVRQAVRCACGESDPEKFRPSELVKRAPACTPCRNAYEKNWRDSRSEEARRADRKVRSDRERLRTQEGRRHRDYDPTKAADYLRLWKYGITRERYDQMVVTQQGLCANPRCDNPLAHVDHDHSCCDTTGTKKEKTCGRCVRGLLCRDCNLILGISGDSIERLLGAVEYLQQWGR